MDLRIKGRTALVCASSQGLGRGCAEALAAAGARVIVNGRNPETLARAAQEIAATTGAEIVPVAADVGTEEGRIALLEAAGAVDILVNNNGGPPPADFRALSHAQLLALAGVARQVAHANVTINGLLPGSFDTARGTAIDKKRASDGGIAIDQARAERIAKIPARRLGRPEEFGAGCAFLCSADAGFITGQNLLIDGGAFPGVL